VLQYPLIQLGQVAPAAAYLKAQRLRAVLLAQTRHYFAANGIDVLLKPAKSQVGIDGLATLLDMPEALLPVSFTLSSSDGEDISPAAGSNAAAAAAADALRAQQQQGDNVQQLRGQGLQQQLQEQLQRLQQQRGVVSGAAAAAGGGGGSRNAIESDDANSDGGGFGGQQQVWLQPEANSIVALPGDDAVVIAVGAAFQAVTDSHEVHPILA
jgi:hypothetical protein